MISKFGLKNCKKCYLFLIVFAFVILLTSINEKRYTISSDTLPWQITLSEDGQNSTVFGITLNKTTARDALQKLNVFPEMAIFQHANGRTNLEAYISSVTLSGLSAKMILEYSADEETLTRYINQSVDKKGTPSGAFKYELSEPDGIEAMQTSIRSISYIPYAQFDDEIIMQRFGIASETIEVDENTTVLLYPEQGLSITYNKEGKEVLQYVAPSDFERLRKLLQKNPPNDGSK